MSGCNGNARVWFTKHLVYKMYFRLFYAMHIDHWVNGRIINYRIFPGPSQKILLLSWHKPSSAHFFIRHGHYTEQCSSILWTMGGPSRAVDTFLVYFVCGTLSASAFLVLDGVPPLLWSNISMRVYGTDLYCHQNMLQKLSLVHYVHPPQVLNGYAN